MMPNLQDKYRNGCTCPETSELYAPWCKEHGVSIRHFNDPVTKICLIVLLSMALAALASIIL